eukprot:15484573-Alexandrium_andersonii.AAC.1
MLRRKTAALTSALPYPYEDLDAWLSYSKMHASAWKSHARRSMRWSMARNREQHLAAGTCPTCDAQGNT